MRGDGKADAINVAKKLPIILKHGSLCNFPHLLKPCGIDIGDSRQLDPRKFAVDPGVVLAHMPHPDDTHPCFSFTTHGPRLMVQGSWFTVHR
jgi:hypothetical protein